MPRPIARRLAPLLLAVVGLIPAVAGARPSAWTTSAPRFAAVDSLQRIGAALAAQARLDSLIALAHQNGDRGMELAGLVREARGLLWIRATERALSLLDSLAVEIAARRDTLLWCHALLTRGQAEDGRRRWPAAQRVYRRALRLAVRAGEPGGEGWARIGIAFRAIEDRRAADAIPEYRRALAAFERAGDRRGHLVAATGLARSLQEAGDVEAARRAHSAVLAEAAALGDPVTRAYTEYNLGSLEHTYGDIALAAPHFEAAITLARQAGMRDLVSYATRSLALLHLTSGQLAQADSVLSRTLRNLPANAGVETRAALSSVYGALRRQQGRIEEALAYGQRALALEDSLPAMTALDILFTLTETMRVADKHEELLQLLRAQRAKLTNRLDDVNRTRIGLAESECLLSLGRPREAIQGLRDAMPSQTAVSGVAGGNRLDVLTNLARCWTALGERDSALATLRLAATSWESMRASQSDPSWRESVDNVARSFVGAYGLALVDSSRGGSAESRAREAFDALQRFRARTLDERVRAGGGSGSVATIANAVALQRALRDDEAFLDIHAANDTTIVFLVMRRTIRSWTAEHSVGLLMRFRRLRDLVSDPTAETGDLRERAAGALGEALLGPAAAELAAVRRVLISAGSLAQYPIGCLAAPGAADPLVVTREVALVPSATLLVRARATAPPPDGRRRALLAVAFGQDDAGRQIPNAVLEARWLASRFARTDARVDERGEPAARLIGAFAKYDALHFATHMRNDGTRPWRSTMFMGEGTEGGAWLAAADIARLRAPVRLCVLAGCASVGGEGHAKETLEGLSTAWLAAGARTVVATLWDADDEATRSLVHAFYEELARGRPAGAALRAAQAATRAQPRWAPPYYWAGVVLLGDPETRLALRGRSPVLPLLTRP